MTNETRVRQALWMAAGAAAFLAVLFVVLRFRDERSPAELLASRAARADLVGRMQLSLTSASEAEKSAVLAVTDEESKVFADRALAARADVERRRGELAGPLAKDGTPLERDVLAKFDEAFAEYRRVDDEVLALAVRNTNLKASALAFGPAADAVREMGAALDRLVASHADSLNGKSVTSLAGRAQIAALRIETLLPPHIAEERDAKMDELEAAMAKDDETVRASLADLAKLTAVAGDAELATATARYATFTDLRARIVALSRENTNVRSLAMSLNQKRKVTAACLDALGALRDAVLAEPIQGVTGGPVRPR
jgi:hypothetical protein